VQRCVEPESPRVTTSRRAIRDELAAVEPTADRDAFQRYVCHTWMRMSCQTPVIRRGSEAQRRARGTPSRRQVTHVPFDPSFEMPDEGGVALTNA
jgi:hypothetical protein